MYNILYIYSDSLAPECGWFLQLARELILKETDGCDGCYTYSGQVKLLQVFFYILLYLLCDLVTLL